MQLKNCEIVLGTVLSNEDPEKIGRIKCGAPGYFNRAKDKQSVIDMPWVYPFTMAFNQSFTVPEEGKKVWLIDNKEVDEEFWYIPFHEMTTDMANVVGDYDGTDIVFSRNVSGKTTQIYSNNDTGLHLRVGNSEICIERDGDIRLKTPEAEMGIKGGHCYMGKATDFETGTGETVQGRKLVELLGKIRTLFDQMSLYASMSPYNLQMLADPMKKISAEISNSIDGDPEDSLTSQFALVTA